MDLRAGEQQLSLLIFCWWSFPCDPLLRTQRRCS